MSNVTGVQSATDLYAEISKRPDVKKAGDDKNQFLELMVAQLKNQSPLDPQNGGEFLAQLAQFSTVEGINTLNETVAGYGGSMRSSQALQATALVGRTVQVPSKVGELGGGKPLSGEIELPNNTDSLLLNISTESGALVRQFALGAQKAGSLPFSFDGTTELGEQLPAGRYQVVATTQGVTGKAEEVPVLLNANVNSVTLGRDGSLMLNVAGVGAVSANEVRKIQ